MNGPGSGFYMYGGTGLSTLKERDPYWLVGYFVDGLGRKERRGGKKRRKKNKRLRISLGVSC